MKKSIRNLAVVITLIFNFKCNCIGGCANGQAQQPKNALTNVEGQRENIEMKIEEFDNEIQKNIAKTEENKVKISKTEKEIKSSAAEIKKVEKKAKKEQELFNSRMRTMYINGVDSYMSIILESESFGDFVSRVENIKTVIKFDKKIVDGFETTKNELNEKQAKFK